MLFFIGGILKRSGNQQGWR